MSVTRTLDLDFTVDPGPSFTKLLDLEFPIAAQSSRTLDLEFEVGLSVARLLALDFTILPVTDIPVKTLDLEFEVKRFVGVHPLGHNRKHRTG